MGHCKEWIKAGKKLAIFPSEKENCPNCDAGQLRVFDIALVPDKSEFERVMFCGECDSHNSLKMNGSHKFVALDFELTESEQRIYEEVKKSYAFTEKVLK